MAHILFGWRDSAA